jgi:hypothetical protein
MMRPSTREKEERAKEVAFSPTYINARQFINTGAMIV